MAGAAATGHDRSMPTKAKTEVPPPPVPRSTKERFFDWMRSIGIRREPGWIGGVGAGIATRLGIDPLIVRGIIVVVAILGGPAFLLYAAAWLLLPDQHDKIHLEELLRGRFESALAGIGVFVLLAILPTTQGFWFAGSAFWGEPYWGASIGRGLWTIVVLAAIVGLVIWVARRSQDGGSPFQAGPRAARPNTTAADAEPTTVTDPTPPPAAPAASASAEELSAWREQQAEWRKQNYNFRTQQARERARSNHDAQRQASAERAALRAEQRAEYAKSNPHPLYTSIVGGLALVVGGIVTLSLNGGEIEVGTVMAGLAAAVAVLAVGIIVSGFRGKRSGGSSGFAVLLLIPLLIVNVFPQNANVQYGPVSSFAPHDTRATVDESTYFAAAGDVTLDLRPYFASPAPKVGDTWASDAVTLYAGAGRVFVLVPAGEPVSLDLSVGAGTITGDAGERSGLFRGLTDTSGFDDIPTGEHPAQQLSVRVQLGAGTITVVHEGENK